MYATASLLALATTVSAAVKGFNYGSTLTDSSAKQQADFESEFKTAQGLVGASGFTSARLYTMVQAGSANDPISAIPAAISTKTSLLLGLWASGGDTAFQNELTALTRAIEQYGSAFTSIVDGISVGSEDLYRNSPQGIAAGSFVGAEPDTIIKYIDQVRSAIEGTSLSGAQIGHVDTWTAWVNGSNSNVASACDWIGFDAYPYFQDTMVNDIAQGSTLFDSALSQTQSAVGGKPVWVTETGWPVSGKTAGQAEPSVENAKAYWDDVGCSKLFGKVNTWWYTLQDAAPTTPNPSFGIVGSTLSTTPLYDLSCSDVSTTSSSSSASASATSATTLSTAASSSGSQATSSAGGDTGGSPGAGGVQSSQISLEASATASATGASGVSASASATSGSGSGSSSGSGSGSGAGSSSGSGSGSGAGSASGTGSGSGSGSGGTGANSTATASKPTGTVAPISSAARLESFGAFLAIVIAILAL